MRKELPPALQARARYQNGVVSRAQALQAGLSPGMIKFRVRGGSWQPMHPGIYATFTGVPGRSSRLWAAVLASGPGATLSHETAAELHRLADRPSDKIHVTIPEQRRITPVAGVQLHRSVRSVEASQGHSYPPRTKIEETVLDLTQTARTFDDVCGWVTRALARELTDISRLRAAIAERHRLRWHTDLDDLILTVAEGDHSVLEFRYHRDVERAHRLPQSSRQVPFIKSSGYRGRRDRVYDAYDVVVELDGKLAHPAENSWTDQARDNAAAAAGMQTLRYGWTQVRREACQTAAQVAIVLRRHGWDGKARPCGPGCPVLGS